MGESRLALGMVPAPARELFESAELMLAHTRTVTDVNLRYSLAHRCALRIAAGVLAVRAKKAATTSPLVRVRRSRPQSAWAILRAVAPEMVEWADYFATHAPIREAAEAGSSFITARMADDAIRDAVAFMTDAVAVASGTGTCAVRGIVSDSPYVEAAMHAG